MENQNTLKVLSIDAWRGRKVGGIGITGLQ